MVQECANYTSIQVASMHHPSFINKMNSNNAMTSRYSRQMTLPEIGEAGQKRFSRARILIIGVGGLGAPIALYLTAAGVGTIGLVDDDTVSLSNLQRQVLYTESEVGQPKVFCAARRLQALNKQTSIYPYQTRLTHQNAEELIASYDIVIDGCDNFATRYLVSDISARLRKPYVYGAIQGFEGQVSVFNYGKQPHTYRDLYPDEDSMIHLIPDSSVIGTTPAVVGSVEANEALKIICGYGEVLSGKLWTIDLRTLQSHLLTF